MAKYIGNGCLYRMRCLCSLLWRQLIKNLLIKNIPDSDHVLRYCKPSSVNDGKIHPSAFRLRTSEKYLSVNWVEYHGRGMTIDMQIEKVRADVETSLIIKPGGRFARINVGAAKKNIAGLTVKHLPEPQNHSHAGIYPPDEENRETVLELSNMVTSNDTFPAKV